MKEYIGTCHCGEIVFTFKSEEITKGMRCNCSICKRLGVIHSAKISPEHLKIVSGEDKLKIYLHGDKDVHFSFCDNCGVYVF